MGHDVSVIGLYILDVLGRPVTRIPDRGNVDFIEEIRLTVAGTAGGTVIDTAKLGLKSLAVGAVGDVAVWSLDGPRFAGAIADPVEAWLRCGPVSARDTVVHGRFVVRGGELVSGKVDEMLRAHRALAARMQRLD